jgi:DNA-binding CsgD family transcriptional regulator
MSFPAVSAWIPLRSELTTRITKIIHGMPFWPAGHPQMLGRPKRRTTTGWLGPLFPFPTAGTPPAECSGRILSGLKRAAPERREIIARCCGLRHLVQSTSHARRAIERAIAHHEVTRGLKRKLDIVRAHIAALTPREREVFALIVRGNTNKHIARALGATERTIKAHRHRVMEKMHVHSLAELVSLAERAGILESASSNRQSA